MNYINSLQASRRQWPLRPAAFATLGILLGVAGCTSRPASVASRQSSVGGRPAEVAIAAVHGPRAASTNIEPGDVLVGLDDGHVEWHGPDGALVGTLDTGAGAETGGMAFDSAGNLYVANSGSIGVAKFGQDGKLVGAFGSGYDDHPRSIVFDQAANAYVGQADGSRAVLKFTPDEIELAPIKAPTESRGTDWIELAADQHTLYYTSQGHAVKRYDLAAGAPLPDFAGNLPGDAAGAVRILPDGGVLVADGLAIMRLNAAGRVEQFYKAPDHKTWVALGVDPDGTSFWAGDHDTGSVCRFDLRGGTVIQSFNVRQGARVCGLAVRGEVRVAQAGGASPAPPAQPGASVQLAALSSPSPDETNVAAADRGGVVESISSEYGPGPLGRLLIDGRADTAWKATAPVKLPVEIVFSFIHRQPALVSAVKITPAGDGATSAKEVEVWTSVNGPGSGYTRAAAQTLPPGTQEQTVSFAPVQARFVKLRILSGYKPDDLELAEVKIVEGRKPGYTPLAERDPEMAIWSRSPRRAAQAGIEWLQVASTGWQKQHNCFGCHSQAQVLMGLAVARQNQYVVSDACMKDLASFTEDHQNKDGTFHDGQHVTATQFAAICLAHWDETARTHSPQLVHAVDWLLTQQKPTGEVPSDHTEAPIDQGSIMTTANTVRGLYQAFQETGNARYKQAAEKGLAWIAAAPAETTQDKVFIILALSRYGSAAQRQRIPLMVAKLKSEQMRDGGWKEKQDLRGTNAFATCQVLYAFKQAGVSVDSPEFTKGVRYLLATQKETGAWASMNSQSGRPSDFAPTMWAVIGLAGSFEKIKQAEVTQEKGGIRVSLASAILFDFDKSNLKAEAEAVLAEIKRGIIDQHPGARLVVEGHTDDVGSQTYNLGLSSRRASSVAEWLVKHGVSRSRLVARGYGKSRPKYPNTSELNRARNRRVEILVVTAPST